MKIPLAKYVCEICDAAFEAPMLGESRYGEFLLWSSSGDVAYLNAFQDKTYQEVADLIAAQSEILKRDSFKAAEVLQNIFGPLACDPDRTGAPFVIGAHPPCKKCKRGRVASWEMIDPPKIVDLDIPSVTHKRWDRLTDREKAAAVSRAVGPQG